MSIMSAWVKDKVTKEYIRIDSEYETKAQFIKDLKLNGYAVNIDQVKTKEVYDYINLNTNCDKLDWKYINKVPETSEEYHNMIQSGLNKQEAKEDKKYNEYIERCKRKREQFLKDIGMTEEQFQELRKQII